MKVVGISNFSLDHVSDILICENVHSYYGNLIVEMLNRKSGDGGTYYYKLVEDNYKLYIWEL